jgi:hypothetical protein
MGRFRWGSIMEYLRGRPLVPDNESRWDKIKRQSIEALADPQPGDYWSDMLSPVLVVVAVAHGFVIFCEKTKETDRDHWTWELKELKTLPLAEFQKKLTYEHSAGLKGIPWAECWPKSHLWVLEALSEPGRI